MPKDRTADTETSSEVGPVTPGAGKASRGRRIFEQLVGIDVRSLALMRIGMAVVLAWDLFVRLGDLEAHYSDIGVLPRAELLEFREGHPAFSFHLASGETWFQGLLFAVALLAALALLVGWRTRTATVVCWLLLASLHARHPLVLHGGDLLLRVLLFWAIFVPWGAAASVDARLAGGSNPSRADTSRAGSRRVVSVGTLALKLQLCGMYWFSAALKWHPVWVEDGTAVAMALRLDQLVTPFGRWLTQFPDMLELATFGTMVLEIGGPILAFVPIFTAPLQLLAVVLFVGFHLFGLAPALYLGIFPWVCAVGWMMFLPSRFWDAWCPDRLRTLGWYWNDGIRGLAGSLGVGPRRVRTEGAFARVAEGVAQSVAQSVVVILLVYVTLWNLRTVNFERWEQVLPVEANTLGRALQIGQIWNLFAPFPATEDGWFVLVGTLVGGEEVEVRTGEPPSFEKPANVSRSLGPSRWRKYMMNLDDRQNSIHRRHYGRYLCRHWNGRHEGDERLASVRIFVMRERTLKSGEEEEPRQGQLWNQVCVLPEEG